MKTAIAIVREIHDRIQNAAGYILGGIILALVSLLWGSKQADGIMLMAIGKQDNARWNAGKQTAADWAEDN